jgi:hypothetical protein
VWRTKVHRTSGFRRSGIDKVRVRHLVKSRVAISRIDLNRRSGRGHVAEDPGESEFGISGIGVSGIRMHRVLATRNRDTRFTDEI